jgi:hypothetical protein
MYIIMKEKRVNMGSEKKNMEVFAGMWDKTGARSMECPQCGGNLVIVQIEPLYNSDNAYTTYDTAVECTSCPFIVRAESFTILGSVKDFDVYNIEIGSWTPSGSRVISRYEHVLEYELLRSLKDSGDLVEFLVVNKQVVQVIG